MTLGICMSYQAVLWHSFYYVALANLLYQCGRNIKTPQKSELFHHTVWLSSANFVCLAAGVWFHSCLFGHTETETPGLFVSKLIGCRIVAEVWFYTAHRLLHTAWLFPFHTIHHKWKFPISFAAFYAHPLENLIGNLFTIITGLHIFQTSHALTHVWIFMVVTQSLLSHSGHVNLGITTLKATHDYHHNTYHCDYGNGLFMDWLLKTRHCDRKIEFNSKKFQ